MRHPEHRQIFIQLPSGERVPFGVNELARRLRQCFLAAGQGESGFLAEDIALAIEYALCNSDREEPVFGAGEFGSAVIRMLEETGLAEVARQYRDSNARSIVTIDCTPEAIDSLLSRFPAITRENYENVLRRVCGAVEKLEIASAPAHLLLELARFYEQLLLDSPLDVPAECAAAPIADIVGLDALKHSLSEPLKLRLQSGVLGINAVSTLFPNIHLFLRLQPLVAELKLSPPVTELELSEPLNTLSVQLGELCRTADRLAAAVRPGELPIHLALPDAVDFAVEMLGCERHGAERTVRDLAEILCASLPRKPYKLTFDLE